MQFILDTDYGIVPGPPPPGFPARTRPTTQIAIRVGEWPGNVFHLWLPESVSEIWNNVTAEVTYQDFARSERYGLKWTFERSQRASIEAELKPWPDSLSLEVRVTNRSSDKLGEVAVMNCLQFSAAPDFACDDL